MLAPLEFSICPAWPVQSQAGSHLPRRLETGSRSSFNFPQLGVMVWKVDLSARHYEFPNLHNR